MKVIIGSNNKSKFHAVKAVFTDDVVDCADVPSHINSQPVTDEETMKGATNRAENCLKLYPDAFCIGLEGGVTYINNQLFLCNWGALAIPDGSLFVASGARIPLPVFIERKLNEGMELGKIMQEITEVKDIRHHLGAIGIFTNGSISRTDMFIHVVKLLKGQLETSINDKY
ncbi:inosine/xanthosine triphosphatase [Gracilibacillus ureilyticus]|uniref:inosine/xanthosine triphosphatase n=1 Tax=Gracilibacillus ureilyticus TaxID=531814 RepID=A0A1H9TD25_9BACI|nr:DUF84 family protein [Gracilibacillus ureilyticus]SER95155.1 inosine/xanthosine triphosphatase [Gracilibacillus ureilyticus]